MYSHETVMHYGVVINHVMRKNDSRSGQGCWKVRTLEHCLHITFAHMLHIEYSVDMTVISSVTRDLCSICDQS